MTTVGDVKTALRVLGESVFDPAEVLVKFGSRVTITVAPGILSIGNATGTTEPEALGPQRSVEEVYDLECVISYTVDGTVDDQEGVTLATIAIFEGFEHAVRSVPGQNLGVAGVLWAGCTGNWSMRESPASETKGRINTSMTFNVRVRAMYRLS